MVPDRPENTVHLLGTMARTLCGRFLEHYELYFLDAKLAKSRRMCSQCAEGMREIARKLEELADL
jgi:hypothetical protein